MSTHPLDQALALSALGPDRWAGATHPGYANMVGPFGGATAATLLQAAWRHPARLGEPVSLTVNFVSALADGPFEVEARAVRTNRSTQHWQITQTQADAAGVPQVMSTATLVTALPRDTWAATDVSMPAVPAPDSVPRMARSGVEWLRRYDMRLVQGSIPEAFDGRESSSLTQLWVRDEPPRPLDFAGLTALADVFFPRIWLRRARLVPVGTVSMTVYFHTHAAELAACGIGHLLGQARSQVFRQGFFDQSALLWTETGQLLASTHQIVYFKE